MPLRRTSRPISKCSHRCYTDRCEYKPSGCTASGTREGTGVSPAVEIIRVSKVYAANGNSVYAVRETAEFASRALLMRDGCLLAEESR